MFKLGALALLGASGVFAETMSVKGTDVEIVRMSCTSSTPPGERFDECLLGSTFIGCADPATICLKKNFRFASCRPIARGVPSSWDNPRVIMCDASSPVAATQVSSPVTAAAVVKAAVVDHSGQEHVDAVAQAAAVAQHLQGHTPVPASTPEVAEDVETTTTATVSHGEAGHDHAKDHDPEEGTKCLHSDLFDTVTGEEKCQCAGRHWRCADKADPITKACDEGFKCVRKNKHYAICADPAGERAAKIKATCEWDMTELPCGVHVGEYRTDKLLARGECPK